MAKEAFFDFVVYQQFVIVIYVPVAACSVRAVTAVRAGFKMEIEESLLMGH